MAKERRMAKIFKGDGTAVITAFDHGGTDGPMPGIIDIDAPLQMVIDAGTDAVVTNIGVAKKCGRMLADTGLILDRLCHPLGGCDIVDRHRAVVDDQVAERQQRRPHEAGEGAHDARNRACDA